MELYHQTTEKCEIIIGRLLTGLYEFKAPIGEIVIDVSSAVYHTHEPWGSPISIVPGHNSHIIEVEKSCGFILILKDGEKIVPYDWEWHVWPVPVDGNNLLLGCSEGHHPKGRRFNVQCPGHYKFEMPDIPGYLPVPEQEVLVKPGEFTEHVIHMQREN